MFLTVPSQDTTAEQKFIQKGEADGIDSLFDLDPKDNVFIVGGVPPDVKVQKSIFSKDNISNRGKGSDILTVKFFFILCLGVKSLKCLCSGILLVNIASHTAQSGV